MAKGSNVWYYQANNLYKPGVITDINDRNVTVTTVSGLHITVPRPAINFDSSSTPLIVNDDSFKLTKILPPSEKFIAVFNRTGVLYLGSVAYITTT